MNGGGIIIITGRKANGTQTGSKNETLAVSQMVADLLAGSTDAAIKAWGADLQQIINQASS